jgi:hypothetical protein
MRVTLTPILRELRAIYDQEGAMKRFRAYVALSVGEQHGEPLPLGVFSPMGQRQPAYLDALIAQDAEGSAERAGVEAASRLGALPDVYRMMLVVADVPHNGWTERHLTDAEWRFSDATDRLPGKSAAAGFDRWVTIQLWTDVDPTPEYVQLETLSALYRAAHQRHIGAPRTLAEMMRQEGRAAAFAGGCPELDADDLAYTREVIMPYLASAHFPTCFAAMYGDQAARAAGYPPLGLSACAGFALGLSDALVAGAAEAPLLSAENVQSASAQ